MERYVLGFWLLTFLFAIVLIFVFVLLAHNRVLKKQLSELKLQCDDFLKEKEKSSDVFNYVVKYLIATTGVGTARLRDRMACLDLRKRPEAEINGIQAIQKIIDELESFMYKKN
ncbi:MAG: hypothetical protein ACK5N8_06390 [Alphaproteobacteria bacterium]